MENVKTEEDHLDLSTRTSSDSSNTENSDVLTDKSSTKPPKRNRTTKYKYVKNNCGYVSLYITSCENDLPAKVEITKLKESLPDINLNNVIDTEYGSIINYLNDTNLKKILNLNMTKIFGKPVQAVPLYSEQYSKIVSFNVPWCIRNEELELCLKKQGINYGKISREKSILYVEVYDFPTYQRLTDEGINFYNSVVFKAHYEEGLNEEVHYHTDNIIQCYRCQGFWHTASTCKQNIRCVRCGEEHLVEHCNRPKNSPVCCNCKGPHHAAYKLCPMRLKLKKSIKVLISYNQ